MHLEIGKLYKTIVPTTFWPIAILNNNPLPQGQKMDSGLIILYVEDNNKDGLLFYFNNTLHATAVRVNNNPFDFMEEIKNE